MAVPEPGVQSAATTALCLPPPAREKYTCCFSRSGCGVSLRQPEDTKTGALRPPCSPLALPAFVSQSLFPLKAGTWCGNGPDRLALTGCDCSCCIPATASASPPRTKHLPNHCDSGSSAFGEAGRHSHEGVPEVTLNGPGLDSSPETTENIYLFSEKEDDLEKAF